MNPDTGPLFWARTRSGQPSSSLPEMEQSVLQKLRARLAFHTPGNHIQVEVPVAVGIEKQRAHVFVSAVVLERLLRPPGKGPVLLPDKKHTAGSRSAAEIKVLLSI